MKDPADLVLDYALRRHFHGDDEVDLAPRITAAWERGMRGSLEPEVLEALDRLDPSDGSAGRSNGASRPPHDGANGFPHASRSSRPAARPRHRRPALLAAAAGLLAVLGAAWWWSAGAPAAAPYARAERAVAVVRAGRDRAPDAALRSELEPGDAIVLGDEASEPLRVALASGAALRVEPGAVLALGTATGTADEIPLTLGVGALEARAAGRPLVLYTGFASVRIPAGAAVAARVALERAGILSGLGPAPRARLLLGAGLDEPRQLTVSVLAGRVDLVHRAGSEVLAVASGARTLSSSGVVAADARRFEDLFEQVCMRPLPMKERWARYAENRMAVDELSALLSRSPVLWDRLGERVDELQDDPQVPTAFVTSVLDFLVQDPSPEARRIGRELWLESPQAFTELHVVGFAERGAFEFQREVAVMVASFDPLDALDAGAAPLLSAAYLALRGDAAGGAYLAKTLEQDPAPPDLLLAAFALEALGERGAWSAAQSFVAEEVAGLLDRFERIAAAELLLVFESFHELRESGRMPSLATLEGDVWRHVDRRKTEVQSEAEIRVLLARLRD